MKSIRRTERGWAGHYSCSNYCGFRRNTLLETKRERVVVSTVGNYRPYFKEQMSIAYAGGGKEIYYETKVFKAERKGKYWEADVLKELKVNGYNYIAASSVEDLPDDVDSQADLIHEAVVEEFIEKLKNGEKPEEEEQ